MFKIKILPLNFHQFEKNRKRLLVFKVFSFQKLRRKLQNFLRSLVHYLQSDQIWRFLQVFGNKLSHKRSPNNLVTFWAICYNVTIVCKKCVATFGQFLEGIRQLFVPSSGHTAPQSLGKVGELASILNVHTMIF